MSEQQGTPLLTPEIRELIQLICQTDITELQIERGEARIHLKRGMPFVAQQGMAPAAPAVTVAAPALAPAVAEQPAANEHRITSPMVGTYYAAPSPKDAPYIKEGDEVHPGDVIGIVEAMKMMNEIECEVHGRVKQILAQNAQAVEYGQALVIIELLS